MSVASPANKILGTPDRLSTGLIKSLKGEVSLRRLHLFRGDHYLDLDIGLVAFGRSIAVAAEVVGIAEPARDDDGLQSGQWAGAHHLQDLAQVSADLLVAQGLHGPGDG
jgi:hypothetical protein